MSHHFIQKKIAQLSCKFYNVKLQPSRISSDLGGTSLTYTVGWSQLVVNLGQDKISIAYHLQSSYEYCYEYCNSHCDFKFYTSRRIDEEEFLDEDIMYILRWLFDPIYEVIAYPNNVQISELGIPQFSGEKPSSKYCKYPPKPKKSEKWPYEVQHDDSFELEGFSDYIVTSSNE